MPKTALIVGITGPTVLILHASCSIRVMTFTVRLEISVSHGPMVIAELRNHHNKWAIIVFDAVPVITYAFGYLVLRGPVLTGSMVLWLAGFGVSICIWFAALVWACTRVRPR